MKFAMTSDIFTKTKRSEVMSRIRGRGNRTTELAMMKLFRRHGITGWRRNQPVFGKPDFIFHKKRVALFVDGCFWHDCPRHGHRPKSNREFWRRKLDKNRKRDRRVSMELKRSGWKVVRFWEHQLADASRIVKKVKMVLKS
jgi:DNA mismatch endonuclease (patch repair protein)